MMNAQRVAVSAAAMLTLVAITAAPAADPQPIEKATAKPGAQTAAEFDAMQAAAQKLTAKGAQFLIAAQEQPGGWACDTGPGVSALVLKALIQEPTVGPQHPAVQRGIEFVLTFQRDNGGIYSPSELHANYESSVALSMFAVMDDPAQAERIKKLQAFVKEGQWDEGEGKSVDDVWYGGAGYGTHKRPDLSNTQMMLEALRDSGVPESDPAYQKALIFIQRCQMVDEINDQPYADGANQGAFIYATANGGESKAGTITVDGKEQLRCYGSISYAAFKSMLYAGLSKDDHRVRAAMDWFKRNWTLEANPNMPPPQAQQGLYYYYHVFARALDAYQEAIIATADGEKRNWRAELLDALKKRQRENGSWVNEADRWYEGMPPLTTAYSMLALQAAFPAEQPVH